MTREEWLRVKEIAAAAIERPEAERRAFAAAQCGTDAQLQSTVESLIDSVLKASHLYEAPRLTTTIAAAAFAGVDDPRPRDGERIGAYEVIREIGRGGMGAAYLARRADDAYQKHVAIKLIKRGMDTDALLRRFRHERQILADLVHPHIVMLLDGGTTDEGLPYFVMEYVDGAPIDEYCQSHALSIHDRLRLFEAVCAAVDHAHEHRVLHRDLKPSNILVTSAGFPKLLDFGIAKLLDPETEQQTAEPTMLARAMTPYYASPEQVRGEALTPASDVYALGVLLYVLLAGRHPYAVAGRTATEIEHAVCHETPRKPSAVASAGQGSDIRAWRSSLAGNLDAIVLTAMNKDPGRRYPTVKAFGEDLRRHLNGLPRTSQPRPSLIATVRRLGARWPIHRAILSGGAILVAIVAASLLLFGRHARPTASAAGARSVAVLPLAHSGDPQLDFLVDGLTEDLITRLSRVPHLKVIARDTAYRYQGKSIDPQQVGRELGVDAVLTGRVTHNDRTVSVSAELIDAHDRSRLWGRTFDRSIDDVQSMQRELAAQIASGLRLRLSGDDHARFNQIYTRNADAYQLYLKGRYFWNKRTGRGLQTAVGYFTQAVAKDPSFALAYSGLADSYGLLTEYHTAPARETYSPAKSAAMKALELDDNLAEAHSSLAYVRQFYEWDWAAAENEFKQAIELNPNYATGHQWYAELLSAAGRHNEALAEIRKAQELDPLSLIVNAVEANILYMARRYDDAIEKSSRVIEMDSNFPEAYEYLKRAFDQKGRYADAIAARQARRRILGKDVSETPALRAAAAATTPAEYWKKRIEQELIEARTEGLQPFEFAELLAQAGDHPRALEYLERACTGHDFMMVYIRVAPNLEPIRSDPRYHEILRRSCRM